MPGSWSSCDGRFKRSRLKLSAQIQTNAALIQTILQQCHVTCIKFPFSFFCPSRRRYRTLSILTIFDNIRPFCCTIFVVYYYIYIIHTYTRIASSLDLTSPWSFSLASWSVQHCRWRLERPGLQWRRGSRVCRP